MERSSKGKDVVGKKTRKAAWNVPFKGSQVHVPWLPPHGCLSLCSTSIVHTTPRLAIPDFMCFSPSLRAANQRPPPRQTGKQVVIGTLQAIAMSSAAREGGVLCRRSSPAAIQKRPKHPCRLLRAAISPPHSTTPPLHLPWQAGGSLACEVAQARSIPGFSRPAPGPGPGP